MGDMIFAAKGAFCGGCESPLSSILIPKKEMVAKLKEFLLGGSNILVIAVPEGEDPDEYVEAEVERLAEEAIDGFVDQLKGK